MSWAEEQSWFGLEPEDLEYLENEHQNNIRQLFLTKGIWTTKTNNHIHITEMKTSHLRNCLNKCERENWRIWALPKLRKEYKLRLN